MANRQNQEVLNALEQQLQLFLNTSEDLQPATIGTDRLRLMPTDSLVSDHPLTAYFEQLETVAGMQVEVEKNELLPDFNLGYAYQNFGGVSGLNSLRAGVSIPIFRGAQRKRIDAAEAQVQVTRSQKQTNAVLLERQLLQLLQSLERSRQALDYFENQGRVYATELVRTARLNYSAGEIGYVEYVQALDQAYQSRLQYLENLQAYNLTVVQINYLSL